MPKKKRPTAGWLISGLILIFFARASAETTVPIKILASVVLKVLEYDRSLPARTPKGVVVGLITDANTQSTQQALLDGFEIMKKTNVQGRAVQLVAVNAATPEGLEQQLEAAGVNLLFAGSRCKESTLSAVLAVARKKKVPAITDKEEMVQKGFVLGVVEEKGKPRIVINFSEIKPQGMDLPSGVLQLAKIVKQ